MGRSLSITGPRAAGALLESQCTPHRTLDLNELAARASEDMVQDGTGRARLSCFKLSHRSMELTANALQHCMCRQSTMESQLNAGNIWDYRYSLYYGPSVY